MLIKQKLSELGMGYFTISFKYEFILMNKTKKGSIIYLPSLSYIFKELKQKN